ncbi:MAG: hypothetical protein QOC93_3767 [Actinomycetota bacterium]|nr:hypothetical protein [Actinomycetota bacterium]
MRFPPHLRPRHPADGIRPLADQVGSPPTTSSPRLTDTAEDAHASEAEAQVEAGEGVPRVGALSGRPSLHSAPGAGIAVQVDGSRPRRHLIEITPSHRLQVAAIRIAR